MSEREPATDAPECKCGEGLLLPMLNCPNGMLRPDLPAPWTGGDGGHADLTMMACTGSGDVFSVSQVRAMQAWWSVGAYEQRMYMERKADSDDRAQQSLV